MRMKKLGEHAKGGRQADKEPRGPTFQVRPNRLAGGLLLGRTRACRGPRTTPATPPSSFSKRPFLVKY